MALIPSPSCASAEGGIVRQRGSAGKIRAAEVDDEVQRLDHMDAGGIVDELRAPGGPVGFRRTCISTVSSGSPLERLNTLKVIGGDALFRKLIVVGCIGFLPGRGPHYAGAGRWLLYLRRQLLGRGRQAE